MSPLEGKKLDVDIVEKDGVLQMVNRAERRTMLAQRKHLLSVRTTEEAISELDRTIEFCEAIKSALRGDGERLGTLLSIREQKLIDCLIYKGITRPMAEDVSCATIEWYYRMLLERHCTATSFNYVLKKAEALLKEYKRIVVF